jgi:di/tricarboxylate transporter
LPSGAIPVPFRPDAVDFDSGSGLGDSVTPSILLVLAIVAAAVVLFVTEWVRYDLVALIVLLLLALTGLITSTEAIQGFSNPAVITIAAVLVLSGGLYRTGIAHFVGDHVLRLAGEGAGRLTLLLMVTAGLLSGIMNNIAVSALLIPVVLEISGRTGHAPSKLLIPLAFASLLGGMTTLIGTAPNILISGAAADAGLGAFGMFAYAPVGIAALVAGVAYMALIGRRLLPERRKDGDHRGISSGLWEQFELEETLFSLQLPTGSTLEGRTLVESRLGTVLGLTILAIVRGGNYVLAPAPTFVLRSGDRVVVEGRRSALEAAKTWRRLSAEAPPAAAELLSESVGFLEATVGHAAPILGENIVDANFRRRFHATVLAVDRSGVVKRTRLHQTELEVGDVLLLRADVERLEALRAAPDFSEVRSIGSEEASRRYRLERRLLRVVVPERSWLDGRRLDETRIRAALDLTVLEIRRNGERSRLPEGDTVLRAGDRLFLEGREEDLSILEGIQGLEFDGEQPLLLEDLESNTVGFAELTLSPRTTIGGRTLQDLGFRIRYGLMVLAIERGGRVYHWNVKVRSMPLQFGDALLLYGRRSELAKLARDPDWLVLSAEVREAFRERKAPLAAAIMAAMILSVSVGWLQIYIAAPTGALLMVVTGCLTADEAYKFIEWKVLVLIAGMLALGLAMEGTGAAGLIAESVLGPAGSSGPRVLLAALFLVTALAAQFMPTAAVAVLMAPIALGAAADLGLSPYALLMVVAIGSSCAFMSPFGHAVNLLVMGVGGYKVSDYTRVGIPLVAVLLAVVLFVLPIVWPLT